MLLLDTHILLWLVEADERLRPSARSLIERERDTLRYSTMAIWEIAMLVDKQRLKLSVPVRQFAERLVQFEITDITVGAEIALDAGTLPGAIHGDPADRIMIATARMLDCALLTADGRILDYAAQGHAKAIDARR